MKGCLVLQSKVLENGLQVETHGLTLRSTFPHPCCPKDLGTRISQFFPKPQSHLKYCLWLEDIKDIKLIRINQNVNLTKRLPVTMTNSTVGVPTELITCLPVKKVLHISAVRSDVCCEMTVGETESVSFSSISLEYINLSVCKQNPLINGRKAFL